MEAALQVVSLATIGGGAAVEMFDDELAKALANIGDVNTPTKAVREIVLKVRIVPGEDREFASCEVSVASKLPGSKPYATNVFLGTDGTTVRAWEHQAKQGDLGLEKVAKFRKEGGA